MHDLGCPTDAGPAHDGSLYDLLHWKRKMVKLSDLATRQPRRRFDGPANFHGADHRRPTGDVEFVCLYKNINLVLNDLLVLFIKSSVGLVCLSCSCPSGGEKRHKRRRHEKSLDRETSL